MNLTLNEVSSVGVCGNGYQMARKFADAIGVITITGKDIRRVRGLLRRTYTTTPRAWAQTAMEGYFYSNIGTHLWYYAHKICANTPDLPSDDARALGTRYMKLLARMLGLSYESPRSFCDALARAIWEADTKQSEELAFVINLWLQGLPRHPRRY